MSERQTEIIQRAADLMIGALNEYRQDAPTAEKVCAQMNALHAAGLTITPQAGEAVAWMTTVPYVCGEGLTKATWQAESWREAGYDVEPLYRTAPPRPVCDGNHAAPACADPECWQRPSQVAPVWQPIESAPRDGTVIVGWSDDLKKRAFVFWKIHHGGNYWALVGQDHFSLSNVTLWQPLSPPPDSPGATEES